MRDTDQTAILESVTIKLQKYSACINWICDFPCGKVDGTYECARDGQTFMGLSMTWPSVSGSFY